jgi:MFS family permease
MAKEVISKFREQPKTKIAWWAMGLGLSTFLGGPIMGINAAVIRPMIDRFGGEYLGTVVGFGMMIATLGILVAAFVAGIRAIRIGERSWVLWIGFVPAALSAAFWVFMIVGEFAFPH